ncbi:MAG TPA: hypothetical protein V6D22_10110 [Candidatus Obscuribacterales bacterium]
MRLNKPALKVAPLMVALLMSCAAANAQSSLGTAATSPAVIAGLARDKRLEQAAETCYPVPDQLALYGPPGRELGTPFPTPMDNYYSGANSRPGNLDNWYGNGYNW